MSKFYRHYSEHRSSIGRFTDALCKDFTALAGMVYAICKNCAKVVGMVCAICKSHAKVGAVKFSQDNVNLL
jgi:hypothetical protein